MLAQYDDQGFQSLLGRLHAAVDIHAFWAAVQSILNEALPPETELTSRDKELLRQLHFHVETTAQRVTARELKQGGRSSTKRGALTHDELMAMLSQLTPAEREIVVLVREGWSNKEIACELGKSIRTVKTQLTSVYKKFSVRTRSRLLARLS